MARVNMQFNKRTVGPLCVAVGKVFDDIDDIFNRDEMSMSEGEGDRGQLMASAQMALQEALDAMNEAVQS